MGNRAVIALKKDFNGKKFADNAIGVYLHWNGGRDSVMGFLTYCNLKKYRTPETDNYGWARLCQVIGNFFGGSTSIGIDVVNKLEYDNWDNGTYLIENWMIKDRAFFKGSEQTEYDLVEFLKSIDKSQPASEQILKGLSNEEIQQKIDDLYLF